MKTARWHETSTNSIQTKPIQLVGDRWHVENKLRQRVLRELRLSFSIDVSYNAIRDMGENAFSIK